MRERGVWDADRAQAALNVFGGAAFAVGSLLFLDSSLVRLGVVVFVLGSFAMFFGALAVWQQRYAVRRRERPARAGGAVALAVEPVVAADAVTSPAEPGSSPGSRPGD